MFSFRSKAVKTSTTHDLSKHDDPLSPVSQVIRDLKGLDLTDDYGMPGSFSTSAFAVSGCSKTKRRIAH